MSADMSRAHEFVAIKIYTGERYHNEEFEIFKHLAIRATPSHPGFEHVRTALDTFILGRYDDDHYCIIQKPMWQSFEALLSDEAVRRASYGLLKASVRQILLALDYLHTECQLIHTSAFHTLISCALTLTACPRHKAGQLIP